MEVVVRATSLMEEWAKVKNLFDGRNRSIRSLKRDRRTRHHLPNYKRIFLSSYLSAHVLTFGTYTLLFLDMAEKEQKRIGV